MITHRRVFPILGLALAAVFFFGGVLLVPGQATAADDCKKLKVAQVQKVCKEGGKKAVKKFMKDIVKKSRKAGAAKTCLDCHKDLKSFAQKPNAMKDLEKLLK